MSILWECVYFMLTRSGQCAESHLSIKKKASHFDDVLFYKVSGKNAVFYSKVVMNIKGFAADLRHRVGF